MKGGANNETETQHREGAKNRVLNVRILDMTNTHWKRMLYYLCHTDVCKNPRNIGSGLEHEIFSGSGWVPENFEIHDFILERIGIPERVGIWERIENKLK